MLPFSLRCVTCGEYMYRGRKFNARKETPPGETYLGIQLYRFYIRCTRCSGEIVFRTDPKNQDYLVERGAKRNTDPWKRGLDDPTAEETDEQRLDRLEREMAEREGEDAQERNAMAELEAKQEEAKREMMVADMLDEIRSRNARLDKARQEAGGDLLAGVSVVRPEDEERRRQEEEDAEAARRAFARYQEEMEEEIIEEEAVDETNGGSGSGSGSGLGSGPVSASASVASSKPPSTAPTPDVMPPPSFKRQVKKKKDHSALLGIKIKKPGA